MKNYVCKMESNSRPKIAPKGTNIPGYYRECEEPECPRLIPCPYVRCQDHRTDFAVDAYAVKHIEPEEEPVN